MAAERPAIAVETITTRSLRAGPGFEARARVFLDAGFRSLALDPELRRSDLEAIAGFFPPRSIRALELFAPLPRLSAQGLLPPPRFAALDRDEEREAQKRALESIEAADQHEIRALVVPRIVLDRPSSTEILRLFSARRPDAGAQERLRAARAVSPEARKTLDACLRSIERLLIACERFDLEVLLRPAGLPNELPSPLELELLRREFRGARLAVAASTLDLDRARRTGLEGAGEMVERLGQDQRAVFLEDGDLARRGLLPGEGEVEWQRFAPLAESDTSAAVTWIFDPHAPAVAADRLVHARERIERLGKKAEGKARSVLDPI